MPSRWERGAGGGAQLTGWAHRPPPEVYLAPWASGPCSSDLRGRGSQQEDQGWGQSQPPLIPATSSSGFRRGVGGAGGLRGSRWGGSSCGAGPRDEAKAWAALEGEGKGARLQETEPRSSGSPGGQGTQGGLRSLPPPHPARHSLSRACVRTPPSPWAASVCPPLASRRNAGHAISSGRAPGCVPRPERAAVPSPTSRTRAKKKTRRVNTA